MNQPDIAESIPLVVDKDGVFRVGQTRVTLDTVVGAFCDGATAEEIVQQFPSLRLDDVYVVLAYYLRHRDEIERYLQQRHEKAAVVRRSNETRFDPQGIRERLSARRTR